MKGAVCWKAACLGVALGCGSADRPSPPPAYSPAEAARLALAEFDTNKDGRLDAKELARCPALKSALASMDKFSAEVLGSTAAANLKLISRWGVGYDAIDVPAATHQGIVIAYTPGMLNETVADCAFALMLAGARRIHLGHMGMIQGEWKPSWGHDVFGKITGQAPG